VIATDDRDVDRNSSGKRKSDRESGRGGAYSTVRVRAGERVPVFEGLGGERVGVAEPRTEFGSPTTFSVLDQRDGWLRVTTPISADNEPLWIRDDPDALVHEVTDISIHADLSERQVTLRDDGKAVLSFPVTVGAPGTETPPGRFAVTDVIFGGLEPVYGCCAIALTGHQANLPDGWIGGDRIAIHGTQGGTAAAVAASAGCLRAADGDVRRLGRSIPLGAPVFIRE
jgi:lipoprotein-anchoring transpeptidase ErfK/SrfK